MKINETKTKSYLEIYQERLAFQSEALKPKISLQQFKKSQNLPKNPKKENQSQKQQFLKWKKRLEYGQKTSSMNQKSHKLHRKRKLLSNNSTSSIATAQQTTSKEDLQMKLINMEIQHQRDCRAVDKIRTSLMYGNGDSFEFNEKFQKFSD
ncbi:hypothetical protein PVAND_000105 [Polypedilum vanderplanki]|uniref:Uncharacterized protein n=1 Tax=Polypedilum vanderplanki TaxID=319348 RepID=A0A9J6BJ08_POLVA|nr:hypothetical protein PVAND_000105 [Polypedilum vanderplanki]